jgi:uncharacterized membrane protein
MSHIIVIKFDNMEEAGKVHHTMMQGEKTGYLDLRDSAVIVCNEEGKIEVKNQMSDGAKVGAVWGGLVGALLAGLVFPLAMVAVGAVVGGLIGSSVSDNVDKQFVNEVKAKLTPGTSAIFVIFRGEDVNAAIASLRPYKGEILHTSLSADAEKALKDELKKRGA